ncbi:MAG: GH3 auxin-responsive promoter family protein [Planctomycetia bacterium]|nr:GH3 auxin-responsive promoter family protein [Planctomycetia bacterium]
MFWPTVARALVGYALAQAGGWKSQFLDKTRNCAEQQRQLLLSIVHQQQHTEFGRVHGFSSIRSPEQYRRQVCLQTYENLEPYINQVKQGNTQALLHDSFIHMFALTSGTTASRKYIPVTKSYLKDYRRGTTIWGSGLFEKYPKAVMKPILQLVSDWDEWRTESNVPCGSVSGLTTHMQKPVVRWYYCMPACTGKIKDTSAKLYLALRMALMRKELGLLVSANPSTLIKMAQMLDLRQEDLLRDLHDGTIDQSVNIPDAVRQQLRPALKKMPGRARQLEQIRRRYQGLTPENAWEPIHTIGCWTGGSVGLYLKQFPQYFGNTPVRDLGLLASEGRMTIPLEEGTSGGVLDIGSHYFEFIPEGEIDSRNPITLTAEELEIGKNYYLLPTTSYGLYRYNIFDVVRVVDRCHTTPVVEFLSKGSLFSNMTGEKLSEFQVVAAMKSASSRWGYLPSAYSLAPYWDDRTPGYSLYLEEHDLKCLSVDQLAADFDECLREQNMEYQTKRESQRLKMIEVCVLPAGTWSRWDAARLAKAGGSSEQYKRPCLINDVQFKTKMPVVKTITTEDYSEAETAGSALRI